MCLQTGQVHSYFCQLFLVLCSATVAGDVVGVRFLAHLLQIPFGGVLLDVVLCFLFLSLFESYRLSLSWN